MKNNFHNHFSDVNPFVVFLYYTAMMIFTFTFISPVFMIIEFIVLSINRILNSSFKAYIKGMIFLIPLALTVIIVNPLFNHNGDTPLLYVNDLPITAESIIYGALTAAMMINTVLLFRNMNDSLNGDKTNDIIGRFFPTIALLVSMTQKKVMSISKDAQKLINAQKHFNVLSNESSKNQKLKDGAAVFNALTANALENSIDTAMAMKSRGFELKNKKQVKKYPFAIKEAVFCGFTLAAAALLFYIFIKYSMTYNVFPKVQEIDTSVHAIIMYSLYTLLAMMPILHNVKEELKWQIIKSKT